MLQNRLGNIYDSLLPEEQAGILKTMLLGDKGELSQKTKEIYQQAGISHILAISGLHVSLIAGIFFVLLGMIGLSKKIKSTTTIILLFIYCIMTGAGVSTVRAFLMLSIILFAYVISRTSDIYTSIGFSAFILLVIQPYFLWDIGFQLSYSAVLGIILISPVFDKLYKLPQKFRMLLGVSVSATISIIPIAMYHFYQIQLYSVLLNIIIVPLLTLVVVFGIIGGIVGQFFIPFGQFFIGIVYYILLFYDKACQFILKLPFSIILTGRPQIIHIIFYYIVLAGIVYYIYCDKVKRRKYKDIILVTFLVMFIIFFVGDNHRLEVTFLDVGQGDSIVISSPKRKTVIIDGGGEAYKYPQNDNTGVKIINPYLRYKGIGQVEAVFLTHSDADHIIGLIELIDCVKINKIYIADADIQKNDLLNEFITKARLKNIPINYISQGYKFKCADINLKCLSPDKNAYFENNNDSSLVLALDYRKTNMLFTGDIEKNTEKNTEHNIALNHLEKFYQVLKIPHHGSKTSSSDEFLEKVSPIIGVISCGSHSKYKHPHKEVLERLKKRNVNIYITAKDGAVTIKTNGAKIIVKCYLKEG